MVIINDGKWYYICIIWDNFDGVLLFFKDGVVVLNRSCFKVGYVIFFGGIFVFG